MTESSLAGQIIKTVAQPVWAAAADTSLLRIFSDKSETTIHQAAVIGTLGSIVLLEVRAHIMSRNHNVLMLQSSEET
jgi:hypothetical protein